MAQTVYQSVLSSIKRKFKVGETFTPYKIQEDHEFYNVPSESFTNAFNALESNKIIKRVNPDATVYSNWSIQYCLVEEKKEDEKTNMNFNIDSLIEVISKHRPPVEKSDVEVPAKVKEQTEKGLILDGIGTIANDLNQIYAKIEKLQTPNNFDASNISTEDLLKEVAKRMNNGS